MGKSDSHKKYCLYARKSSEQDEKQALSIDGQIQELKELAKRLDIPSADIEVRQESHSAKTAGQRAIFNGTVDDIKAGKFVGLLAWAPDRLSRNAGDAGILVDLMDSGLLKEIITPSQKFSSNNPSDKFLFTILCSQAKLENDNKGVNVKRGLRIKRRLGIFPAGAPPGYKNVGKEKGNKRIASDPKRLRLIQMALKSVLQGVQPVEALRILNEDWGFRTIRKKRLGGGPLASSTWYEILHNPFYCGSFISKGEWYKGIHEPIITEEEYWKIQKIMGDKGRPRPQSKEDDDSYLGLFECGVCGLAITRDEKRQVRCLCKYKYSAKHRDTCPKCDTPAKKVPKERKHEHHYLICAGHKKAKKGQQKCIDPAMKRSEAEEQVLIQLGEFTIPQEFIDWAFETLEKQTDENVKTQQEIESMLLESLTDEKKKLSRLDDLYLKGTYEKNEEEYDLKRKQILAKAEGFKNRLAECRKKDALRDEEKDLYTFAKNVVGWFNNGGFRTRIQILNSLGGKGIMRGKTIILTLDAVYVELKNVLSGIRIAFPSFEPENFAAFCLLEANQATVAAIKSTWLATPVSNQKSDTDGGF